MAFSQSRSSPASSLIDNDALPVRAHTRVLGAIVGAFLIQGAQSYLGDTFLNTWLLVLGAFFILVVRFLPKGLAGLVESILGRLSLPSKRKGNDDVAAHRLYPQPGE